MADGLPPVKRSPSAFLQGGPAEKPKNLKGTLWRLWDITKGSRKGLGWILLLSVLASASAVFSPFIIGTTVNQISAGQEVMPFIALLAGLYVCDWLVRFLQQFFMAGIGQRIILHIREALFGAMKKLPLAFFDTHQHGELMSRLTNDVDNVSISISDSLSQLMIYLFTVIGVLVIMLASNVLLTFVSCVSVVFMLGLTNAITKRTRKLYAAQQKYLGKLNGQIEESISGVNVVKAFCREGDMINEFEKVNESYCGVATKAAIISGYLMPITNVINNFSYLSVAVVAGIMCAEGHITVGMISSFLLYSRQFARPFVDIANIYNNFQSAVAGAERVFDILDEGPEPEDAPGMIDVIDIAKLGGNIEFKNVVFGYTPDKSILKGFSLSVPAGTHVAIVGETGAGKTTIINLLTRFYDVDSGSITLDGHDLRDYKLTSLRRAFGVVLQDTSLFGDSVRSNIAYGSKAVPFEQIRNAAIAAGADAFITRLPKGYDTVLEQGDGELSQGERQLLTIARAILTGAPILILDEATSSVDTLTERKIREAILRLSKNRTSFIIAHRLSTIRESGLIILIDDGRIAERGTHDELIAQGGKYAEMYRAQTSV